MSLPFIQPAYITITLVVLKMVITLILIMFMTLLPSLHLVLNLCLTSDLIQQSLHTFLVLIMVGLGLMILGLLLDMRNLTLGDVSPVMLPLLVYPLSRYCSFTIEY